jgi:hypothetical protein
MELTTLVFKRPGPRNTEATLQAVRRRAEELGIRQFVVASTHGQTALGAMGVLKGLDPTIVAVSICAGFDDKGWTMSDAERKRLEEAGIRVLTSTHTLGDDVNEALGVTAPNRVVRQTLYRFCQGMKVAVEIALMAADAGLLDTDEEAIAVAGTDKGADTAIVVRPACSLQFDSLRILEVLAKPR